MRFKESIAKGLLISLAVALIPVAAFSAPKVTPGSACKVLNQRVVYQNKTYTCIKSGKKLLWNKGVVVNAGVKPTPSQSSAPAPLTRREKALGEVKRVFDLNTGYQPTVKYIFANDAPPNFAELIKEVIPFASRFWSSEFRPTTEFPIILGSPASVEWVNSEMKRYGHEIPAWNREFIAKLGENASRGDVVNNSRGAITYYVIGKEKDRSIKAGNELTMRGFVAHEYVHAVAISIIGDREKGIPGWSVEGSANFYGFAMAALMADQPNIAMNRINIGNLRRSYSEQGALVPHSLNKDDLYKAVITSEKGGGGDGTTCAEPKILCYTAGALFTEVLVADYGHNKFIDWWKLSRQKNWEVAFEEVFGIQIDKWYEEVAIPYVIQESKGAVPEVPAPKSASTFTQHAARPPRPFVVPGNQNQKPTPTPIPVPTSFSDLFEKREGISFAVWSQMSSKISQKEPKLPQIEIIRGPNTPIYVEDPSVYFKQVVQLFPDIILPKKFVVFYWTNQDRAVVAANALAIMGKENDQKNYEETTGPWVDCYTPTSCDVGHALIGIDGTAYLGIGIPDTRAEAERTGGGIGGIEKVEFYHALQLFNYHSNSLVLKSAGQNIQSPFMPPTWLNLGTENLVNRGLKNIDSYSNYKNGTRYKFWVDQVIPNFSVDWLNNYLNVSNLGKDWSDAGFRTGGANKVMGSFLTEIFVSLKGPSVMLQFHDQMSRKVTFTDAFQNIFGISWQSAQPELSKVIYDRYIGDY